MTARARRVVVVVGASGAIGRAIATDLARDHRVFAADRAVERDGPRRGTRITDVHVDVRDEASVRALRDVVYERARRVDALVYSVGVLSRGSIRASGVRGWQDAFEANVLGAVRCIRVFAELMAKRGSGRIVLIGSLSARAALPGAAAYAATKAALESLARTAAVELAPAGIAVMCVSPGYVVSPMTDGIVPPGPMAEPAEIAEVVRAALALEARCMSGAHIEIGGGIPRRTAVP